MIRLPAFLVLVALAGLVPPGVTVPVHNADTSVLSTLKPLRGKAFDTAYIQTVGLEGHRDAVEITEGQNAELKNAVLAADGGSWTRRASLCPFR